MKCKLVQPACTHSRKAGKGLTDAHIAGCTGNSAGLEPKDAGPKEEEFLGEKMQEQWLKRENAQTSPSQRSYPTLAGTAVFKSNPGFKDSFIKQFAALAEVQSSDPKTHQ